MKKGNIGFSTIALIIIALIGGMLIITIIASILGVFSDPNKIEDGVACRLAIMATSNIKSATQGFLDADRFLESCKIIEKKIPMKDNYPTCGGKISRMSDDNYKCAVKYDLAELVNNAWWISGEGEKADYLLDKLAGVFVGKNDCYVMYAVRIHSPRKMPGISEEDFVASLLEITRAQLKGGSLKGDQRSIMAYLTNDNKGAGVVFKRKDDASADYKKNPAILFEQSGSDALYGIAVGFAKEGELPKLLTSIFKDVPSEFQSGESFIYIAPYEEVASLCTVSN